MEEGIIFIISVSSYTLWRWGWGSFSLSVYLPLPWVEWERGEGLICIIHNVTPSTWDGGRGEAHLHHQCVSLYLWWRWGRGSFPSSTECLRWEIGGLICTISVPSSTLGGGELGGSFARYLDCRWGWGSFASSTECLPLTWWEMGTGLICIIHDVTPFEWSGDCLTCIVHSVDSVSSNIKLICIIHSVSPSNLGEHYHSVSP